MTELQIYSILLAIVGIAAVWQVGKLIVQIFKWRLQERRHNKRKGEM